MWPFKLLGADKSIIFVIKCILFTQSALIDRQTHIQTIVSNKGMCLRAWSRQNIDNNFENNANIHYSHCFPWQLSCTVDSNLNMLIITLMRYMLFYGSYVNAGTVNLAWHFFDKYSELSDWIFAHIY